MISKQSKKYASTDWQMQLGKLSRYCKRRFNYEVAVEKCDCFISTVDLTSKRIAIHEGHTPERQLYMLVHEIGHIIISENTKMWHHTYGFCQKSFSKTSLTNKISELEEEYGAWRVGYDLAKKIRIPINRREFEKVKATCLSSYIMHTVSRKVNAEIKAALKDCHKKTKRPKKEAAKRTGKK